MKTKVSQLKNLIHEKEYVKKTEEDEKLKEIFCEKFVGNFFSKICANNSREFSSRFCKFSNEIL